MQRTEPSFFRSNWNLFLIALVLSGAASVFMGRSSGLSQSPWENAGDVLRTSFTGTIARGLSLVAIVVRGLRFAFGEEDSKLTLAGIVFGVGMAIVRSTS